MFAFSLKQLYRRLDAHARLRKMKDPFGYAWLNAMSAALVVIVPIFSLSLLIVFLSIGQYKLGYCVLNIAYASHRFNWLVLSEKTKGSTEKMVKCAIATFKIAILGISLGSFLNFMM